MRVSNFIIIINISLTRTILYYLLIFKFVIIMYRINSHRIRLKGGTKKKGINKKCKIN